MCFSITLLDERMMILAKKKADVDTVTITFRAPADVAAGLKDLAHLSRRDVSTILNELCSELVAANKQRILSFRRSAAQPIKLPTFATSTKKSAEPAQVADKGGDEQ